MTCVEILHLLAHWYGRSNPWEVLRDWEDLRKFPWYGDTLDPKQKFMNHFDDTMEEHSEPKFNDQKHEIHDIVWKKPKGKYPQKYRS